VSNKSIGLDGALYDYYCSVAFREADVLKELRGETAKLGGPSAMQIGPEQGAFMAMLVKLMGARRILEIGTFTGYSALAMALAGDVHIIASDVSKEWTDVARRFWSKAGVAARIDLRLAPGAETIAALLKDKSGQFDLMFIDADKPSYDIYYEGGLKLLRSGGLMLIDNVLWDGKVADPAAIDEDTSALRALNAKIVADARVEICMVPICDGVSMVRKK
jgi:predicted O-methyltransferase YrrM